MTDIMDAVKARFPSVKLVVFTGGECFLLGKALDQAVSHAKRLGFLTRCVTNGFWAKTPDIALKRVRELRAAGLTEINFSAGFAHQEFVHSESVLNGAISAAKEGMVAIVSVENRTAGEKRGEALSRHPLMARFNAEHPERSGLLRVMETVWVSETPFGGGERTNSRPCDNILDSLVITPDMKLKSCCGLSVNSIPEMSMGCVSAENIRTKHAEQFDDFLKIWLKVDGPESIIKYVRSRREVPGPASFSHPCQACGFMYSSPEIRSYIREHFQEKMADVLFRFSAVKEVTGRVNSLIGYGA